MFPGSPSRPCRTRLDGANSSSLACGGAHRQDLPMRIPLAWLTCLALALACALPSCATTAATPPGPPADDVAAIRATIDELYAAFCFDAGREPDWETQRRIYLEGAAFVPPIREDRTTAADNTAQFLADFQGLVSGERFSSTGFHERIIGLRIDAFGGVAHAFVAFEGFLPGDGETLIRGLDSIQLVKSGREWRLVSFTTQYERDGAELPLRFIDAR